MKPARRSSPAVQERASRHLRAGRACRRLLLAPQRVRQLLEEERHPVLQLRFRGLRGSPAADLLARARDDLLAVEGQEFVQHGDLQGGVRQGRSLTAGAWP